MADDEDLFGDEDLVEEPVVDEAPVENLEDDLDEEPLDDQIEREQQEPKSSRSEAEERKEAMRLLSEKRKREANESKAAKSGGSSKKKSKSEKEPDKKKRKKNKEGDEGKAERPRRKKRPSDDSDKVQVDERTHARNAIDDVNEDEIVENEEDKEFIDDEGEEGEEGADGEEDVGIEQLLMGRHEEAEEVRPGEEGDDDEADDDSDPFGHKKRKPKKESDQQLAAKVDEKLAKMEAAAEADLEQHLAKKPAIYKLKLLADVEDFLAQKKYHEIFINNGGLGVLKSWIEPYADGSLPNARIRSAVLKACQLLPIDLSREDIKGHLKKSQLGARIMFLHNCPDENPVNKRLAFSLINQWTRPIFHDPEEEERKRRLKEKHLAKAREMEIKANKAREEKAQALLKQQDQAAGASSGAAAGGGGGGAGVKAPRAPRQGEAGFRWHASIPQASKLDYVNQPKLEEGLSLSRAAAEKQGGGSKDTRFERKMREVVRKSKTGNARAAKPSIEGRSITILAP